MGWEADVISMSKAHRQGTIAVCGSFQMRGAGVARDPVGLYLIVTTTRRS